MFGRGAHVDKVKGIEVLNALSRKEQLAIARLADEVTYPPGGVVVREGRRGDAF